MYNTSARGCFTVRAVCFIFIFSLFLTAHSAQAVEEKEAAKAIVGKYADTVIALKATIKLRFIVGGSEQSKEESEVETLATVIDPSGLSVLSFSSIDPSRIFGGLLKKLKASKEGPQMDIDSSIASITMVLPDGREIPAKIVLRDADLDLAFVRPTETLSHPIAALDISGSGKADVLDTICVLGRLDKTAGRSSTVSLRRIEAVIAIPRKYYVADSGTLATGLGAPVFSLDGKVVGLSLLRFTKTNDKSFGMVSLLSGGMNALGMMPVILPIGEVSTVAKQALAIKDK